MDEREDQLRRESGIQGARWETLHQGYFSHPAIADPLVEVAAETIAACRATVVADLGGGTGMLLRRISERHPHLRVRLVDVDVSARQLAEVRDGRVQPLNASALEVRREDLQVGEGRLMLLMRSLLHYFGREGLRPLLRHLRDQLKPGEAMVHQTACFLDPRDALCANRLYEMMRTHKWYPAECELREVLEGAGWDVSPARPAPPLALESADLAERYQLSPRDLDEIRRGLEREFGPVPAVFAPRPGGFIAWLHYAIFICRAK